MLFALNYPPVFFSKHQHKFSEIMNKQVSFGSRQNLLLKQSRLFKFSQIDLSKTLTNNIDLKKFQEIRYDVTVSNYDF